jgi:hypothetical protein
LLWNLLSRSAAVTLGLFFGKKSELLFFDTSLIFGKLAVTIGTAAIQKTKTNQRNLTEKRPTAEKNLNPLCPVAGFIVIFFSVISNILTETATQKI